MIVLRHANFDNEELPALIEYMAISVYESLLDYLLSDYIDDERVIDILVSFSIISRREGIKDFDRYFVFNPNYIGVLDYFKDLVSEKKPFFYEDDLMIIAANISKTVKREYNYLFDSLEFDDYDDEYEELNNFYKNEFLPEYKKVNFEYKLSREETQEYVISKISYWIINNLLCEFAS